MLKSLLMLLFLVGCASKMPTATDYGTYPQQYKEITRDYLLSRLKDPESARFEYFTEPKKQWVSAGGSAFHLGYAVCVTYNAKNSYGGYVGSQTEAFLIRDDRVLVYTPSRLQWGRVVC